MRAEGDGGRVPRAMQLYFGVLLALAVFVFVFAIFNTILELGADMTVALGAVGVLLASGIYGLVLTLRKGVADDRPGTP